MGTCADPYADPGLETWHHPNGRFIMIGDGALALLCWCSHAQHHSQLYILWCAIFLLFVVDRYAHRRAAPIPRSGRQLGSHGRRRARRVPTASDKHRRPSPLRRSLRSNHQTEVRTYRRLDARAGPVVLSILNAVVLINTQRHVNHLPDGEEQRARDALMAEQNTREKRTEAYPLNWTNPKTWKVRSPCPRYVALDDWSRSVDLQLQAVRGRRRILCETAMTSLYTF